MENVELSLACRDGIIVVLRALQHVHSSSELTDRIFALIAADINRETRTDTGRETKALQEQFDNQVKRLSFDRGFHSPENQNELSLLVPHLCLPKPGAKRSVVQQSEADDEFRAAQQNHPGVESAIGALQSANAMKRCRDRSEVGCERYLQLAILGRNLHTWASVKFPVRTRARQQDAVVAKRREPKTIRQQQRSSVATVCAEPAAMPENQRLSHSQQSVRR